MIGKSILHYKIVEKLGEGGMGIVYLAEDTKLERQVAIKFLPSHIAKKSDERKRFEIEAKAAAALNHPNIATIHAIEEADDDLFLVMEYIPGKHLKDHIKNQPLAVDEAIKIAIQVAEGLQAAHKKGIVHRDIKSANIMSNDDGNIKIMDFGLAKFGGSVQLTHIGTTLGTAAYMSPEQAKGEEVDQRSDIWSLGVEFYEMLTGTLPFKGDYEQAVVFNILNEEAVYPDQIPQRLKAIIQKTLARNPNARYQNSAELLKDLKSEDQSNSSIKVTSEKSTRLKLYGFSVIGLLILVSILMLLLPSVSEVEVDNKIKRLAVLPLKNLGSIEQEYFADGLTGEIISQLSSLSGLSVIARSSAMHYKNSDKTLKEIGSELDIDYIVDGTLQWEMNENKPTRIRVNPELIKISDATQIWSQPYESDFSGAFKLQADIATQIAEALNVKLFGKEKQALQNNLSSNTQAYDFYMQALHYIDDIENEKHLRIAIKLLEQAIEADNNFASAYSELSGVQSDLYWMHFDHSQENRDRSKANAVKALDINPQLPLAHAAMGDYWYHGELNYEPALVEFRKSIELDPGYADGYQGIANVLRRQGKLEQSLDFTLKALKFNPKDYTITITAGETSMLLQKYDMSDKYMDMAASISPPASSPPYYKALNQLSKAGNTEKARNIIEDAQRRKIEHPLLDEVLYMCDMYEGKFQQALKRMKEPGMDDQYRFVPMEIYLADAYYLMNDNISALKNYKQAQLVLEEKLKSDPNDHRLYSSLGLTFAGLGEKVKAVKAGKRGIELMPVTKEAWRGRYRLYDMAIIYVHVAEYDLAINTLQEIFPMQMDITSSAMLKMDPIWEPLRTNKHFQDLIEKYAYKK